MSRLTIRHGPRSSPVWTGPLGDPPPVGIRGPHHGVLPLALEPLARIGLDARVWADLAPVLEGILDERREATAAGELSLPLVRGVAHAARAAGVRSYAQSMRAALEYAETIADAESASDVELWSIKEGRAASVWRVRIDDHVIALNVARDDIAAGEQVAMGRELSDLHALDPLGVVDVLDIAPDVLACAWIDGRELHVVDRGDGRGLFVAVEDSASAAHDRQLMLPGREGVPASDTIWASWLEALVRQTTIDARGRYRGLGSRPTRATDAAQRAAGPGRAEPGPGPARPRRLGARSPRPALGRARARAALGRPGRSACRARACAREQVAPRDLSYAFSTESSSPGKRSSSSARRSRMYLHTPCCALGRDAGAVQRLEVMAGRRLAHGELDLAAHQAAVSPPQPASWRTIASRTGSESACRTVSTSTVARSGAWIVGLQRGLQSDSIV